MEKDASLKEIGSLFLKLGCIGVGGPAAHIAMMRDEAVVKKKWIDEQHFLDLIGATNLIPGPNSTEMALHIGREKAGIKGLFVAGVCFILPAVAITGIFAWLYKSYGQLPEVQPFLYGIQPAIVAIILSAVFPLARKSLKSWTLGAVGLLVLACSLIGINEVFLLFCAGFLSMASDAKSRANSFFLLPLISFFGSADASRLFWIFLKIGAILYGSGYVLFAFLDAELVATGLLTRKQLVDAIAVGQFTPGPVFSAVTFIGYQVDGISGAAASTIAIFLPAFAFVALLNPLVKKMRNTAWFSALLDGVNIASVAIIVSVCFAIARDAAQDWRSVLIGLLSLAAAFRYKINSAIIVFGAAAAGFGLSFL